MQNSPARILIKNAQWIIKLCFSIKKHATISSKYLEFRYSRTKQFLSLRGFGVSTVSQGFRIESNRDARKRRYNPESLCLWKIKSILVAILNSTLASKNKGNKRVPVAYRGNRFETMPTILVPLRFYVLYVEHPWDIQSSDEFCRWYGTSGVHGKHPVGNESTGVVQTALLNAFDQARLE